MTDRSRAYFVSDVHLGLRTSDPAEREERFVNFLKGIPRDGTLALYLLGDIWDFWYEYRDVIPREGARVVAQLVDLMDAGVKVRFFPGNHDIWCYSFFQSLGIEVFREPVSVQIGNARFHLGHGDGLGGARWSYRFMQKIFHCRFLQRCFSTLHPWIAFRFGLGWSTGNRRTHEPYHFRGAEEPLYRYAVAKAAEEKVDYFIFGHFHDKVRLALPCGSTFVILKDWMDGGVQGAVYDLQEDSLTVF